MDKDDALAKLAELHECREKAKALRKDAWKTDQYANELHDELFAAGFMPGRGQ